MPKINQTTWIVALSTIDSGISNELAEPEVPGIVTITNPEGGEIINFTAGLEGTSPITSYVATVIPSGPTATVVSADLAVGGYVELSDFNFDFGYIVSISAVNEFGQGEAAFTNSFTIQDLYNEASGGTETIVSDYNGTGERWKIHRFEASGTLSVTSAPNDFRYLVVGAGGSGGGKPSPEGGGGGCGGVIDSVGPLSVGDIAITVGVGQVFSETGNADGSSIGDLVVAGGGGQGGSGYGGGGGNSGSPLITTGAGGNASNQQCGGGAGAISNGSYVNGGFGLTTNIDGSVSQDFAGGGGGGNRGKGTGSGSSGGGQARNPSGDSASRIGSGGGGSDFDGYGGSGFRGEVVVAYEISSAFNVASGGTETIVDDYNGSGQQWKVHDFGNTGGTFTVESSTRPFRVMAAGQPGAGGLVDQSRGGGGGGGGEVLDVEKSFAAGDYPVTAYSVNGVSARSGSNGVTSYGGAVGGASGNGNPGGGIPSVWNGGGGGGAGGPGAASSGNPCTGQYSGGGAGVATNISGSSQVFGYGGGGGAQSNGCSGQAGKVVIAYQIGVSTLAQIKVAQTVRKAELRKQQLEEKAFQKQQALKEKLRK